MAEAHRLRSLLAAWPPPAEILEVPWQEALRRAIAPAGLAMSRRPRARWGRFLAAGLLAAVLAAAVIVPAAAAALPDSPLYAVRGIEDQAQVAVLAPADRPRREADLAAVYLWQARAASAAGQSSAYRDALTRFFYWSEQLLIDATKAGVSDRRTIRSILAAEQALLSQTGANAIEAGDAAHASSVLGNVEKEFEATEAPEHESGAGGG
ncbi:MAG TPA: hypothetical protein VMW11_09805 [Candidatus Dormibacteraeota bacterium]|nr:hypothetical protein [Candidatus Dormibacteraeota bacterium]